LCVVAQQQQRAEVRPPDEVERRTPQPVFIYTRKIDDVGVSDNAVDLFEQHSPPPATRGPPNPGAPFAL
jgi:hypothetical protein